MTQVKLLDAALTRQERDLLSELTSPPRIQAIIDTFLYSTDPVNRSPVQVLRDRVANCFDGALFAAAALRKIGYPPLILDMIPDGRDDDHILALFKQEGHWGAIAKSNFSGLRFREPIYRNLRELVLSYFEQYYNIEREKTLRGYTIPLNLKAFDKWDWMTSDAPIDRIGQRLDEIRRYDLLTPGMAAGLSLVDERLYTAGLMGADEAGLYKP